jgi:hypothetical protein
VGETFVAAATVTVGYTEAAGERGGVIMLRNGYGLVSQFLVFILEEFTALWGEVGFAAIGAPVTNNW